MTTDRQREHLAQLMDALVFYRRRVHYAQVRPMRSMHVRRLRPALLRPGGLTMDCSETVTFLCRLAGLRDPNGLNYNGAGYTGTLLSFLEHYTDPSIAKVGALCVFGDAPGEHVCMVRKPGADPLLFSHGTETEPQYHPLSYMRPGFTGAVTFLSIARLGV